MLLLKTKLTLARSLLLPLLDYGDIAYIDLKEELLEKLERLQNVCISRFLLLKRQYKNRFSAERLERIDHMIEAANVTCYTKLANCVLDLKKTDAKDIKKKKGWTESEWKKHMDYIGQIAGPRKNFLVEPPRRGLKVPLEALLPRINQMSHLPYHKCYRRLSQESFYRDPIKVARSALKYIISDRVKKLSAPRPQFVQY